MESLIINACFSIANATFNLAHWLFAFSYMVLSYRIELSVRKIQEDTHKFRLNFANIFVCLLNVAIPLIDFAFASKSKYKGEIITIDV